jgi:hypothetical protein
MTIEETHISSANPAMTGQNGHIVFALHESATVCLKPGRLHKRIDAICATMASKARIAVAQHG